MLTTKTERSQINKPTARVLVTVNANIKVAFDYIQPVPLNEIFLGTPNIPAVVKTDEKEFWITAGKSRTVTFADGNTAYETMVHVDFPSYFSYRIENFSSDALRSLIERVDGAWVFVALDEQRVMIDWKYVITPKNEQSEKIIIEHVLPGFQNMLNGAIGIVQKTLESKK